MVAVLLAPAVQHFLHRFHLELDERREAQHRRRAHPTASGESGPSCSLPVADCAQRTADFRALLADAFRERSRSSGGVQWILRAIGSTEAESHRLAALEARCCDVVRFHVERRGDEVLWTISGPAAAQAILDAFYELPVLVRSDDGARALLGRARRRGVRAARYFASAGALKVPTEQRAPCVSTAADAGAASAAPAAWSGRGWDGAAAREQSSRCRNGRGYAERNQAERHSPAP